MTQLDTQLYGVMNMKVTSSHLRKNNNANHLAWQRIREVIACRFFPYSTRLHTYQLYSGRVMKPFPPMIIQCLFDLYCSDECLQFHHRQLNKKRFPLAKGDSTLIFTHHLHVSRARAQQCEPTNDYQNSNSRRAEIIYSFVYFKWMKN